MTNTPTSGELTTRVYWDAIYESRDALHPVDPFGSHARCTREILSVKKTIGLEAKRVLEIGAGGSPWLAFLAKTYPSSEFTALDYSEVGIESLRCYANDNALENITFIVSDMFTPPEEGEHYDLVFSHGVVEHFPDLPEVLVAHSRYLSENGVMLTIIPNMAGILGCLTKVFNRDIYTLHVPHDIDSFRKGHEEACLHILESGYLCSNNFGVLSSCFERTEGWKWSVYKFLSRVSKAVWWFEDNVASLPTSSTFSPYMYVISRRGSDFSA